MDESYLIDKAGYERGYAAARAETDEIRGAAAAFLRAWHREEPLNEVIQRLHDLAPPWPGMRCDTCGNGVNHELHAPHPPFVEGAHHFLRAER